MTFMITLINVALNPFTLGNPSDVAAMLSSSMLAKLRIFSDILRILSQQKMEHDPK